MQLLRNESLAAATWSSWRPLAPPLFLLFSLFPLCLFASCAPPAESSRAHISLVCAPQNQAKLNWGPKNKQQKAEQWQSKQRLLCMPEQSLVCLPTWETDLRAGGRASKICAPATLASPSKQVDCERAMPTLSARPWSCAHWKQSEAEERQMGGQLAGAPRIPHRRFGRLINWPKRIPRRL